MTRPDFPTCEICGDPAEDTAIRRDHSTYHRCTRTALRRCAVRQAAEARQEIRRGFAAGARICARNAVWYRRRAGDLEDFPPPGPAPVLTMIHCASCTEVPVVHHGDLCTACEDTRHRCAAGHDGATPEDPWPCPADFGPGVEL